MTKDQRGKATKSPTALVLAVDLTTAYSNTDRQVIVVRSEFRAPLTEEGVGSHCPRRSGVL